MSGSIVSAIVRVQSDLPNLRAQVRLFRDAGCDSTTVHLGTGFESDSELWQLCDGVLSIAQSEKHPVYVETHRATMTQDIYRTLRLIELMPDLRFTLDFGQWYLGHEIPYGDWEAKLGHLEPVFQRTRLVHLRLSSGACGQISVIDAGAERHLPAFRRAWTEACRGFLSDAAPGDYLGAYAELLPPRTGYPRMVCGPDGTPIEAIDRWEEAGRLLAIAKECFADARKASAACAVTGGPIRRESSRSTKTE